MTAIIENAKELVIDKWGTLNTAASPAKLPDGHSPRNQNVWMDEKPGSVVTANGYQKLGELPSGNPPTLLIDFFKTSDGSSKLICSDNESVWWTTDYVTFTLITSGLSAYFQLRGAVIRDKLWLTNGSDDVMTWDGTTLTALNGDGTTPDVPLGRFIAYHDERVWLYGIEGDLSSLRFSSLTDSSGVEITPDDADAWPADNELQISEGDADQGTALFLYRGYLYPCKQYSIWRVTGYDEYTYTRVKTRSGTGTRFQESVQIKDDIVHFIGIDGLYQFDGENSTRISDIVDPSSSEEGTFAFRNLQQTLLNTRFWNVTDTADFGAGTVPNVLSTDDDKLALVPADDTQADFNSGTKTRVTADDNVGFLQLSLVASGSSGSLVSVGKTASLPTGTTVVGSASFMTDGSESSYCGYKNPGTNALSMAFMVDLGSARAIGRVILQSFYMETIADVLVDSIEVQSSKIQYSSDGSSWSDAGTVTLPSVDNHGMSEAGVFRAANADTTWQSIGPSDITTDFSSISARYWRFLISANPAYVVLKELEIYDSGFEADGKFVSASIDYGTAPATYGKLAATITANGENYQFFTQSSNDAVSWDAEANLSNGAAITSNLKRYLRWGVYLYSSTGVSTPVVDKVYIGGTYISEIHNTGGSILQWGAFQSSRNNAGQTITYYYRAGASTGAVSAASWTAIVPGAVPNTAITNTFIQIRIEMSTDNAEQAPFVESYTVNWVLSSTSGAAVLQNVASVVILNRYWLSAATLGAEENDIVLVLGKNSFSSPWHMKDFAFLSFCRFQDYFIAGSSLDGSIYRLETGYSKNGEAMDAFYETRDFSADNFFLKGKELLVTCDRSGPYNLSVGWSLDGGLTYTEKTIDLTRESGESLSFTKRLNINYMGDSIRFRVRINAADQPFSVDEIRSPYQLSPQRGSLAA